MSLITTAPTVAYKVELPDGKEIMVDNPTNLPEPHLYESIREPIVRVTVHCPKDYVGSVFKLCEEKRGVQKDLAIHGDRAVIEYDLPLNEIVLDFHDRLKSSTKVTHPLIMSFKMYQVAKLVKLDIRLNGENVDALSSIVHHEKAFNIGT